MEHPPLNIKNIEKQLFLKDHVRFATAGWCYDDETLASLPLRTVSVGTIGRDVPGRGCSTPRKIKIVIDKS